MEGGYFYNIMFRSIVIFLLFILFKQIILSQDNFQKIYLFEDTFAIIHDVYVTDSCYYVAATSGKGYGRVDIAFAKIQLNGEIDNFQKDITPTEYNLSFGCRTQLDTNFRGNFMFGYVNRVNGMLWFPQITEVNVEGSVINHIQLLQFQNDSIRFADMGKVMVNNVDSSYFMSFNYYDNTTDDDSEYGDEGEAGVFFGKVNLFGDTIWTKKFRYEPIGYYKPIYSLIDFKKLNDNLLLLILRETKQNATSSAQQDWSKLHFYHLDQNGNVMNHYTFQDSQFCYGSYGVLELSDGGVIQTYFESRLTGTAPNSDYFISRPIIARLGNNFQLVWKDTLLQGYWNLSTKSAPYKLISVNDTIFAGAFTWDWATHHSIDSVENWSEFGAFQTTRIFNRNINGSLLWNRDFMYWSPTDSSNEPEYEIWDIETTFDGGFIACGQAIHKDSITLGKPGQFGYILKTNCLGFLGDPQTAVSFSYKDSFIVEFVNSSIQAGSYKWVFGDGDTLDISEYVDTVLHHYSGSGDFAVKLIGYGCNGASDTLHFTINVPDNPNIPDDTTYYTGDGTFLTFYPNPSKAGESIAFYVGNIPDEEVRFELVNELGEMVFSGIIPQKESTYILPIQLAHGMYFGALQTISKRLETEKLVIH
jgi:hypothetical protein